MNYSIQTLLLLVLVFLTVQTQSQSTESSDLISKTCKKTPYYDICLSSLQSSPQSSNSDTAGLAHIIADLVLSNATDTLDYIHGLLKQSPEADIQKPLANCAELYIPVVKYTLPESIDALSNGHYGFANYGISDAAKEAQACEKGFSGTTKSPLTDRNTLVSCLSQVAVAIINLVQG
ncbi:cell wall / vacuolar inhibitor of fructosidase 1 [Argentina anserina]|uniref:cell wall / vacuolar inhibitor of fructosidase 1 n=1 Tax=Argentina anserina TaxID=57926 RepID=UPI0021762DFD|nr:cell wall / vacuolar inhibitor of fructosidase 1 [Potentilla anserina]